MLERIIMQAKGLLRRVDETGRIILPAHIRRKMMIDTGSQVEIWFRDDELVVRKYNPEADMAKCVSEVIDLLEYQRGDISEEDFQESVRFLRQAKRVLEGKHGKNV